MYLYKSMYKYSHAKGGGGAFGKLATRHLNPRITQREGLQSSVGLGTQVARTKCMLQSFTGHLQRHSPPYLLFSPFKLNPLPPTLLSQTFVSAFAI